MKTIQPGTALLLAATLAACSSVPVSNATLDVARRDYVESSRDPNVASLASAELKQASEALDRATGAWMNRTDINRVDRLANIASERVEIAKEVPKRK